jgi:hypothetical protein
MKKSVFRCVVIIVMACGLSGIAGATPIDFKMNVLDPPSGYSVTSIFSTTFPISFSTCASGELPGGLTASGCFAGQNLTGQSWNNLQFMFTNSPALGGQPASCGDPGSPFSIFTVTSCSLSPDNSTYILAFTNGIITPGEFFFVTEDGPDPSAFGVGTGTVLGTIPEPTPALLVGTGLMMFGLLFAANKRYQIGLPKGR